MKLDDRTNSDLGLANARRVQQKSAVDALQTKAWHDEDSRTRRFKAVLDKLEEARARNLDGISSQVSVDVSKQRIASWLGTPVEEQQFSSNQSGQSLQKRKTAINAYERRSSNDA